MSTPNLEVELCAARTAFNEIGTTSPSNLQALGERYQALLGEYLSKLHKPPMAVSIASPHERHQGSHATATQLNYKDSIEWAEGEQKRVVAVLEKGSRRRAAKQGNSPQPENELTKDKLPQCKHCNKPVESLTVSPQPGYEAHLIVEIQCHGERVSQEIPSSMLEGKQGLARYKVFNSLTSGLMPRKTPTGETAKKAGQK